MQLTANGAHMVVDFYPVKYSDGTISERLMYKTVTFCGDVQSKSYINTTNISYFQVYSSLDSSLLVQQ